MVLDAASALAGGAWAARPYVPPVLAQVAALPAPGPGRTPLRASAARGSRSTVDFCRSFAPLLHASVPPHTLILGTLPSVNSFDRCQYYATPANAFWWLVGDALGHRRAPPPGGWADSCGRATTVPRFITSRALHAAPELGYEEAVLELTAAGYAVWDVLHEAEREGSTDPKIRSASERANDLHAFLGAHPSIGRVCFSGGASTAARFMRANRAWLATPGEFCLVPTAPTLKVFGKLVPQPPAESGRAEGAPIELCVMLSVSGAFVAPWRGRGDWIYVEKRADWFENCFRLPAPPLVDGQASPPSQS